MDTHVELTDPPQKLQSKRNKKAMSGTPTGPQNEGIGIPSQSKAFATSTPAPVLTEILPNQSQSKPDVSQLFQKLGDKLGWFQYNNIDTAIETLSKSAKKKSTRSRRDKASGKLSDDISTLKEPQSNPRRKHKEKIHQKHKHEYSEECKENKRPTERHLKVRSHSPHGSDSVCLDDGVQGVSVRKSAACTDLTRSWTNQGEKKNHRKKIKNTVSVLESPNSPEILTKGRHTRLPGARSSSESPEYLGDYVTESTRIHSDASLECVLDSVDVSAISFHRNGSLSGSTCMDSFQYNSNEDSYKQLNIKNDRPKTNVANSKTLQTSPTSSNVCLKLQALSLENSKHCTSKGNNSSRAVNNSDLYTTAYDPHVIEDSVEVIKSSYTSEKDERETSSGSSYEVEDVAVQVHSISDVNQKIGKCASSEESANFDHKVSDTSSGSGSSYEVEDVSVQAELISEQSCIIESTPPKALKSEHKHFKSASDDERNEDDSFVEVEDVSMQTSFQVLPDHQPTGNINGLCYDSGSNSSCDVIKENAALNSNQMDNEKEEILEDLHNISLPGLDMQPNPAFTKREPSIYFDAKDLPQQSIKFNRRDPSIYFDAKQSLLSSSHSSNSSYEPTKSLQDSTNHRKKGNNFKADDIVSVSDTDSDDCQIVNTSKIASKKEQQTKNFSSNSEDEIVSHYFPKDKTSVKSQRKYSLSTDSSDDSDVKSLSIKTRDQKCIKVPRSTSTIKGKRTERQNAYNSLSDSESDQKMAEQLSNKHWRTKQNIESSSDEDDALETFLQKMRGSKKKLSSEDEERAETMSMKEFIVEDWEVSDDDDDEDDVFHISTAYRSTLHSTDDQKKVVPVVFNNSSSEDEDFKTPKVTTKSSADQGFKTPLSTKKKPRKLQTPMTDNWGLKEDHCLYPSNTKYSFLKSLTENLPVTKCDPEAVRFIRTFKKSKQELTQRLFKIYNETVFDNKLPQDVEVIWNCRLLRTAGYCVYKKVSTSGGARSVRIELSTKVCDSAERVRDTLIHEMCHAAVWLVNGMTDGHGPYWRYWAKKSNQTHPEIPVIGRCHSYSINTKFTYQCSQCGYRIDRHSKSLNMDTKVCGYCHGRFTLLSNSGKNGSTPVSGASTPRTPNKFALFVKDNYGDIKKREQSLKHKDIMKILSQEFAKNKISA
ncbi:uncharacterized protein LOC132554701 [Ylistrum balloti]|uniref:uncharacterized protein LOC132554701 n=1 Tax=Ylistrum balloti TaxID=509963 RepID=UPI002905EF3B|nr:uncharacterized protein LOC132554701 [Ylistrum balloti]